jgi:peptide/nickel transport system permease protein
VIAPAGGSRGLTTLVLLACLLVAGLCAPMLAPYDPDEIVDVAAARYLPPGSALFLFTLRDGRNLAVDSFVFRDDLLVYRRGGAEGSIPADAVGQRLPATRRFLLGTDNLGRDLLSRMLRGARVSLGVGLLAVALGIALGAGMGALCGYAGGFADAVLMRLVDILQSIPRFFLFVICAALFGPSALLLVLVLGATGWMGIARLTRGQALSIRHRSFVEAARALGGGAGSIVLRHLLPQCAAPLTVASALLAADTILAEASLSFLGIGIQPPTASWGNIIAGGRDSLLTAWWITAFPGLAIMATVLLLHAAGRWLTAPDSAGGAQTALLD